MAPRTSARAGLGGLLAGAALPLLLIATAPASAVPFIPDSDQQVLVRLPPRPPGEAVLRARTGLDAAAAVDLARAVILAVQGRPRAALASCRPLWRLSERLLAAACSAHSAGLTKEAAGARRRPHPAGGGPGRECPGNGGPGSRLAVADRAARPPTCRTRRTVSA